MVVRSRRYSPGGTAASAASAPPAEHGDERALFVVALGAALRGEHLVHRALVTVRSWCASRDAGGGRSVHGVVAGSPTCWLLLMTAGAPLLLLLLLLLPVAAEPAVATGMSAEPSGRGAGLRRPRAARRATMRVLLRVVVVVVVVLLRMPRGGLLLLRRGSRLLRVPRSRRRPKLRGGWTLPRGRR